MQPSDLPWPVTTARLSIRPATAADAEPTWRFRRLPEVTRWLTRAPTTLTAYAEHLLDPERLTATLVVEREGEVVGDLMLRVEDAWAQAEVAAGARGAQAAVGWCLDPAAQGRGYATEAMTAVLDLCFGPLGLHRVVADCFAANEPSWRLMERLGMRREAHTVADSLHRTDGWLDGFTYAVLAEEWSRRGTAPG